MKNTNKLKRINKLLRFDFDKEHENFAVEDILNKLDNLYLQHKL